MAVSQQELGWKELEGCTKHDEGAEFGAQLAEC